VLDSIDSDSDIEVEVELGQGLHIDDDEIYIDPFQIGKLSYGPLTRSSVKLPQAILCIHANARHLSPAEEVELAIRCRPRSAKARIGYIFATGLVLYPLWMICSDGCNITLSPAVISSISGSIVLCCYVISVTKVADYVYSNELYTRAQMSSEMSNRNE
jgi:hypothetical protein